MPTLVSLEITLSTSIFYTLHKNIRFDGRGERIMQIESNERIKSDYNGLITLTSIVYLSNTRPSRIYAENMYLFSQLF